MNIEPYIPLVTVVVSFVLSVVAAKCGMKYQRAKTKVGKVLDLFDMVYDAAKDDEVTEEEFQRIVDLTKELVTEEEE